MTIDWQPLKEIIARHDSFLLTSHCRADCDAVGSELALARCENISEKLKQMAMEEERVELHQLDISEYDRLPKIFNDFMNVIEEYGMNPFKGM